MSPLVWKNFTYLIGLAWLIYGAMYFDYMDWDINISLLMSLCTYLSADHFIRAIKTKSYPKIALWSIAAWWSIDGVYWLYWSLVEKTAMIREGQWAMSACLYLLCGMIWTAFDSEKHPIDLHQRPKDLDLSGS
jgi:hypothetical protein